MSTLIPLLAEVLAKTQAPMAINALGAATEPMRELRERLNIFGYPEASAIEDKLHKYLQQTAPTSRDEVRLDDTPFRTDIRVGALPTINEDGYDDQEWWLQIWEGPLGESRRVARIYGSSPGEVKRYANSVVAAIQYHNRLKDVTRLIYDYLGHLQDSLRDTAHYVAVSDVIKDFRQSLSELMPEPEPEPESTKDES